MGKLRPWRPASCRCSSSRRTSSPARVPDWEQEEGKLCHWCPASCRGLVIPADVFSRCHDTLLSPNAYAPGGGDSSTRQVSSSMTHSVTGPGSSASMEENPANAISVFRPMDSSLCSSVYFYLPLRVNTLHICFFFQVSFLAVLMLTPWSAESLPSRLQFLRALWRPNPCFSFSLSACVLRCLRPYLLVADIPRPQTSLGGAASPLLRPRSVEREGCVRHPFPLHTPSLRMENLMKR